MNNPAELELGYNTVDIAAGSQGYYYTWTAPETGYFSLEMFNENWFYTINNMTTYAYGDGQWSDSDPVVNPAVIFVNEGDVLQIIVNTYNPEDEFNAPAETLEFNTAFGGDSLENPFFVNLVWNDSQSEASATVTIPAGLTVYFGSNSINNEMLLTVNGAAVEVTYGNRWLGTPSTFVITNDGDEAAEYTIKISFHIGTMSNPAVLVDGTNTAEITAGSQGYYFTYVAEAAGTLSLEISAGENGWTYTINNMTSYVYGEAQWSDSDPVVNPATVEVAAGDEIQIIVNTYDPADQWNAPAGTVTVVATFTAA